MNKMNFIKRMGLGLPILVAAGMSLTSAQAAQRTQYPLVLENCGQKLTFTKAPERTVSIGQAVTEVLYSLDLSDKVVGTAVWFSPVLPQFTEQNAAIKRLADNDPSFESVVNQQPDLVTAEFEWHVGPQGSVAKREQFQDLGINTYIAPADCVAKVNTDGGDGVRKELFSMDLIYQEISELAQIYDVQDKGEKLIADLKKREADAIASVADVKGKDIPIAFWFSSKEVQGDAYIGGKNGAPAYILHALGAKNILTTEEEWPLVSWETIINANPALIVIGDMDRRRYAADDPAVKIKFMETDPVVSKLDAVEKKHFFVLDAQAMSPTIRVVDGIEGVAKAIRDFKLAK